MELTHRPELEVSMADFIVDSTKFYASGDGLSQGNAQQRVSAALGSISDPITDAAVNPSSATAKKGG